MYKVLSKEGLLEDEVYKYMRRKIIIVIVVVVLVIVATITF